MEHGDFLSGWASAVSYRLAVKVMKTIGDPGIPVDELPERVRKAIDYALIEEGQELINGARRASMFKKRTSKIKLLQQASEVAPPTTD